MVIYPVRHTKIFGDSFFGYVWGNIKFGKTDSYIHVLTTYIPVYVIVLYQQVYIMSVCRNRMRAKKPSHFFQTVTTHRWIPTAYGIYNIIIRYVYGMCTYVCNDVYDTYNEDIRRMYVYKNIRDSILRRQTLYQFTHTTYVRFISIIRSTCHAYIIQLVIQVDIDRVSSWTCVVFHV